MSRDQWYAFSTNDEPVLGPFECHLEAVSGAIRGQLGTVDSGAALHLKFHIVSTDGFPFEPETVFKEHYEQEVRV